MSPEYFVLGQTEWALLPYLCIFIVFVFCFFLVVYVFFNPLYILSNPCYTIYFYLLIRMMHKSNGRIGYFISFNINVMLYKFRVTMFYSFSYYVDLRLHIKHLSNCYTMLPVCAFNILIEDCYVFVAFIMCF